MQHKRLQGLCTKNSQWYSQTEGNDMLNRCDFRCVLKVQNVQDRRRSTGRQFQARGPAMARAQSPMVERCVAGTRPSAMDAERSRRRESTSDSGWINSDRYCGMQSLYWMHSGTRSQCKFTSSGVTWSNLRASAVSRAAAFSTDWIRSRSRCGNPARATLQLSILDVINDVTNINSASRGSERRMQHICLRTPKHEMTSRVKWASIDMSPLRRTPRSPTLSTGATDMEPTVSSSVGSWCCRLGGTHHLNSVFAEFSWIRLADMQLATELIQSPRSRQSDAELLGWQTP